MHKAFKKYKVFVYPDANMAADQSQSVFYKIIYIYIYYHILTCHTDSIIFGQLMCKLERISETLYACKYHFGRLDNLAITAKRTDFFWKSRSNLMK